MRHQYRLLTALSATTAVLLCGCGTNYSLKEFSPVAGQPKSAFVDIKQRAVLSAKRPSSSVNAGDLVMCAEPSPDALSSLASELGLDAKYKDSVAATLGFAQQESAAYVGLRTQTIQLLRDGMYRLCEGYMSGALSPADYAWLSRRYQRNMVALLTIEQLTQVVRPPTVALTSQGTAAAARSATAIQAELEETDKSKARLEDEKKKLETELADTQKLPDTDATKAEKAKDVQRRLDEKKAVIARVDEVRTALLESLKNARGILLSGSTSAQVVTVSDSRASVSDAVATKIAELASKVLEQDDLPTLCFQLVTGDRAPGRSDAAMQKLLSNCADLVERGIARDIKKVDSESGVSYYVGELNIPGLDQRFVFPPTTPELKPKAKLGEPKKQPGKN